MMDSRVCLDTAKAQNIAKWNILDGLARFSEQQIIGISVVESDCVILFQNVVAICWSFHERHVDMPWLFLGHCMDPVYVV